MVEKELGAPIDELFSEFSAKPIAAASLAQVGVGSRVCSGPGVATTSGGLGCTDMTIRIGQLCACLRQLRLRLGTALSSCSRTSSAMPPYYFDTAQVYFARVRATGQAVAVKVQRPGALSTISKDLYVMRRGVGVYEQLVKRFTAQTTDYQQLLSTFAEGLYTEMDFRNEVCLAAAGLCVLHACHNFCG